MIAWTAGETALVLIAVSIGGFMMGIGLIVGTFVVKLLRHYMREEKLNGLNGKS